jgi:hypothetical protein
MIIVHHLDDSRSQRILWLLEELGVPYEIKQHMRDPQTLLAPPALKQIHPLGKSPVIEDNGHVIAESGAIVAYILRRYGNGKLQPSPSDTDYDEYIQLMHYAEGSAMPALTCPGTLGRRACSGPPVRHGRHESLIVSVSIFDREQYACQSGIPLTRLPFGNRAFPTHERLVARLGYDRWSGCLRRLCHLGAAGAYCAVADRIAPPFVRPLAWPPGRYRLHRAALKRLDRLASKRTSPTCRPFSRLPGDSARFQPDPRRSHSMPRHPVPTPQAFDVLWS